MSYTNEGRSHALALLLTIVLGSLGSPGDAGAWFIANGDAPPNPENVIDAQDPEWWAYIKVEISNEGCVPPFECETPGAPTEVEMVAGARVGAVAVHQDSLLRVLGGTLYGSSVVEGPDGEPIGSGTVIEAWDRAQIELLGGYAGEHTNITLASSSRFEMSGGAFGEVNSGALGNELIRISGGSLTGLRSEILDSISISGGSLGFLEVSGRGTVSISDGDLGRAQISGMDAMISGGRVERLEGLVDSRIAIHGGVVDFLHARDEAVSSIHGHGFRLDGVPVEEGFVEPSSGVISGTLDSGEPLQASFVRDHGYLDSNGIAQEGRIWLGGEARIEVDSTIDAEERASLVPAPPGTYVARDLDGAVTLLPWSSEEPRALHPHCDWASSIAIDVARGILYLRCEDLLALNAMTGELLAVFQGHGLGSFIVDPTTGDLLVTRSKGIVSDPSNPAPGVEMLRLDPSTGTRTHLFDFYGSWTIDVDPVMQELYWYDGDGIWRADLAGGSPELWAPSAGVLENAFRIAIDPTRRRLYAFTHGDDELVPFYSRIVELSLDESPLPTVIWDEPDPPYWGHAGMNPDSGHLRWIVVEQEDDRYLYRHVGLDPDTSTVHDLASTGYSLPYLSYPDSALVTPPPVLELEVKTRASGRDLFRRFRGPARVTVWGDADFDLARIDPATLRFGPDDAAPAAEPALVDLDGDGFDDLLLSFSMYESGIAIGDEEACLGGTTVSSTPVGGCGAIVTTPACGLGFEGGLLAGVIALGRRRLGSARLRPAGSPPSAPC